MADGNVDLQKMKVPELKQALKEKGLPVSGTKAELVKRLGEALGATVDTSGDALEDSLQGIDDILDEDSSSVTNKTPSEPQATPASPAKPAAKEIKPILQTQKSDTTSSNGVAITTDITKPSVTDTTFAGKPAVIAKFSEAERLKMRAEKFGATSTDAKKELRAQRFGLPSTGGDAPKQTVDVLEQMKKRADRFGAVSTTSLSKVDEDERKRKRAERFGTESTPSSAKKVVGAAITDMDNEAKKRKRAERFGIAT